MCALKTKLKEPCIVENNNSLAYNKQIDGLRCFAVLGVMVFHFIHFENIYISRIPFGFGVDLFFVISGFLITKILLLNKESIHNKKTTFFKALKTFYYRRTLRIFPIYYLTIIFLLIIDFQNTKDVWKWLVSYTTNFYISYDYPYIGSFLHLWSLAVEEQFYLLWPLLIFVLPKKHIGKFIVALILFSIFFKIYYFLSFGFSTGINAFTISCSDSLGFGALIAYWSLYRPKFITTINKLWFLLPLSFIPFFYFIIYPRPIEWFAAVSNNFLFSFFAFFILIRAAQMKYSVVMRFVLENRMVVNIGKISYGLYLYHLFMPDFYNQMADFFPSVFTPESPIRIPFLFVATLLFAICSWLIIERPVLLLKKKLEYAGQ